MVGLVVTVWYGWNFVAFKELVKRTVVNKSHREKAVAVGCICWKKAVYFHPDRQSA